MRNLFEINNTATYVLRMIVDLERLPTVLMTPGTPQRFF